jgi:phage tail sheath protein FI
MPFFHGARASEASSTVATPLVTASGIPFVVGTAPVQSVTDGKVNVPVMANSYDEAVAALGYSDDWKTYTLCEFMDAFFKLYKMSPVIFMNVLDPATAAMKEAVAAADKAVTSHQIKLSIDAIDSSVVVKAAGGAGDAKVLDTDYALYYDGEYLVIEELPDGGIYAATSLSVAYSKIKISGVTSTEIIGGYSDVTKKTTGLECINQVIAMHSVVPDIICAPGWSHNNDVAAAMATKAAGINGLFPAKALIDADATSSGADHYSEVAAWKATNSVTDKTQILCWPLVAYVGKTYHLSSHIAGLIAQVDKAYGCPGESPSNKTLVIDSIVTDDGDGTYSEVVLTINEANILNAAGIVTALSWFGKFVLWGNSNANYPASTVPKDYFINVSRMFDWVGKNLVLTTWLKVDKNLTRRVIDSIVDATNIWLNGLTADEKLLGGRVELKPDENPITDIAAGIVRYHEYLAAPFPGQTIEHILEYDEAYVRSALAI